MSIDMCEHCGELYDQDFEVEHPEICEDEQREAVEDEANNYHNQDGKE